MSDKFGEMKSVEQKIHHISLRWRPLVFVLALLPFGPPRIPHFFLHIPYPPIEWERSEPLNLSDTVLRNIVSQCMAIA